MAEFMRGEVSEGGWDDPVWDLPPDQVSEVLAARESEAKSDAASGRGIDRESPEQWSARRAGELQALLPEASRGRVTMAAAVAEASGGERTKLVATSEARGYLRKEVRGAIEPDEVVVRGRDGVHAEVDILDWSDGIGAWVIAVGAGRPICRDCAQRLDDAGTKAATPEKEPKW